MAPLPAAMALKDGAAEANSLQQAAIAATQRHASTPRRRPVSRTSSALPSSKPGAAHAPDDTARVLEPV